MPLLFMKDIHAEYVWQRSGEFADKKKSRAFLQSMPQDTKNNQEGKENEETGTGSNGSRHGQPVWRTEAD